LITVQPLGPGTGVAHLRQSLISWNVGLSSGFCAQHLFMRAI
jgi:hypothetical protein